jgi:hypothetical protein
LAAHAIRLEQFCGLCEAIPCSANTIPIPFFATNKKGNTNIKLTLSPVKLTIGKWQST